MSENLLNTMIPTLNEARHIQEVIACAKPLGKVFVLDSGSTDGTQELAREAGAIVVEHSFEGYARQKNWGLDNLPFDAQWVLILDADERITPELQTEIRELLQDDPKHSGYYLNRLLIFMEKRIRHGGLYPSWNLRLFKRGTCRYEDRSVHEHMVCNGSKGYLKHHMLHLREELLFDYIRRHIVYADLESDERLKSDLGTGQAAEPEQLFQDSLRLRQWIKRRVWPRLFWRPLARFFYMYLLRFGFLDGRAGWHLALLMCSYEYMIDMLYIEKYMKHKDPNWQC